MDDGAAKCEVCTLPMMCGQKRMHLSCAPTCVDCGLILTPDALPHTCTRSTTDGDHA